MEIKVGSKVELNGKSGTIDEIDAMDGSVLIRFDDSCLIPPTMWVSERYISYFEPKIPERCPKCKYLLKKTLSPVLNDTWIDCVKCGKRIEDLM
jgi:hypothetical protein